MKRNGILKGGVAEEKEEVQKKIRIKVKAKENGLIKTKGL